MRAFAVLPTGYMDHRMHSCPILSWCAKTTASEMALHGRSSILGGVYTVKEFVRGGRVSQETAYAMRSVRDDDGRTEASCRTFRESRRAQWLRLAPSFGLVCHGDGCTSRRCTGDHGLPTVGSWVMYRRTFDPSMARVATWLAKYVEIVRITLYKRFGRTPNCLPSELRGALYHSQSGSHGVSTLVLSPVVLLQGHCGYAACCAAFNSWSTSAATMPGWTCRSASRRFLVFLADGNRILMCLIWA